MVTTTSILDAALSPDEALHAVLATPAGQSDPYPLFRHLRETAPVHRFTRDGNWYATGFEAARLALGDPRFAKGATILASRHGMDEARVEASRRRTRPSMITSDPPEHTRLRGAAKGAFTPTRMDAIRARVADLVEERLDVLADGGGGDLMEEVALPLPITVIGELVGVPPADRDQFRPLVTQIMGADRPAPPPDALERSEAAFTRFRNYFDGLIDERAGTDDVDLSEDLLGTLVAAARAGALVGEELHGTVTLVFIAGFLTTTNLIGNGLAALFAHPQEQARLWREPSRAEAAVEEMLRYDTPVQMIHRVAREDVDLAGAKIGEGETVFALLGAANRDPKRFAEPDRFDLDRADNSHLAFAWGVHFCLGARLARMEAELVFAGMARRFRSVAPAGEPVRSPGLFLRGYQSLPVQVTNR